MKDKESPLKQEIGPKKYKQKLEAANKHYDKHLAGKTDPKTGIYYRQIGVKPPKKAGKSIASCECLVCEHVFSVSRSTVMVQCSNCQSLLSIKINPETEAISVEVSKSGR